MICIPSLSPIQLEILMIAKQNPGEVIHLSFETPMFDSEGPPPGNPQLVQELIDWGLIEVHFKHVHASAFRSQRESWAEYCSDLSLPSIRAWELWRQAFIEEQVDVAHDLTPGEGFGEFSEVWVEEFRYQAVRPG